MRGPHGVLILQDPQGLVFCPEERVALVMVEHAGRITIVDADGAVAHDVATLEAYAKAPFRTVADGTLAHPARARREGRALAFPGGWRFPVPQEWPARSRVADPPDPEIPDTGLRASEILYAIRRPGGHGAWVAGGRQIPMTGAFKESAALHPHLVPCGRQQVNLRRLRRVHFVGKDAHLTFDSGVEIAVTEEAAQTFARAIGLASPRRLNEVTEMHEWMFRLGLRDWPIELFKASASELRRWFGDDERSLIANVIFQVFRWRAQGRRLDYGRDHRGFWYRPLFPILVRAGFARHVADDEIVALDAAGPPVQLCMSSPHDPHYQLFMDVVTLLVGTARLVTYEAIGFEEPRPDLHGVGKARPDVLLLAEKSSLAGFARELAARFDVSWCVLGGDPTWHLTEFVARALLAAGVRSIRVTAYTDFDPAGWAIPDTFSRQLERYGVAVTSVGHLVRPERFSDHELEYLGEPLPAPTPSARTFIIEWLKRSGGVHGRGIGIHADHLRPLERVIQAFVEETGLAEIQARHAAHC